MGEKRRSSLFLLPNYPAWFGADTFLLAGSAMHWIVVSVMAYQLSRYVGSPTVAHEIMDQGLTLEEYLE